MAYTPIIQIIADLPAAPDSQNDTPSVFNAKANAWVAELHSPYTPSLNVLSSQMNVLAGELNSIASSIPVGTINDTVASDTDTFSSNKILSLVQGRNILTNGEVTRINQRIFDGSSFVDGEYCWDRWKATATKMTQIVADGNFVTSTVYTLSGIDITTQQITSPASGHWTIPEVPRTARNIQLEIGAIATNFEVRSKESEMLICMAYFQPLTQIRSTFFSNIDAIMSVNLSIPKMRIQPAVEDFIYTGVNGATVTAIASSPKVVQFDIQPNSPDAGRYGISSASLELNAEL